MTAKEKYEVHGIGPYFIFDKETQRMVSMISFTTEAEAQAFIEMLELADPCRSNRGRTNND